jgi:hypothetical protein
LYVAEVAVQELWAACLIEEQLGPLAPRQLDGATFIGEVER